MNFDTINVRGEYRAKEHRNAVFSSIYQTTAFALSDGCRADRLFSFSEGARVLSTVDVLEKRLAALHDASMAFYSETNVIFVPGNVITDADSGKERH